MQTHIAAAATVRVHGSNGRTGNETLPSTDVTHPLGLSVIDFEGDIFT